MKRKLKLKVHQFLKNNFNLHVRFQHPRSFNSFLKDRYGGKRLIGVEIGVAKGKNAEELMEILNIEKLYLVDPYDGQGDYWENEENVVNEVREEAKERLSKYENKIEWIEKNSDEAVNEIEEDLDFVYIDGNHDYEFVKDDIENYWPKIREGGIIGGHDINLPGVTRAVWEFSKYLERHPSIVSTATQYPEWLFIKKDGSKDEQENET